MLKQSVVKFDHVFRTVSHGFTNVGADTQIAVCIISFYLFVMTLPSRTNCVTFHMPQQNNWIRKNEKGGHPCRLV